MCLLFPFSACNAWHTQFLIWKYVVPFFGGLLLGKFHNITPAWVRESANSFPIFNFSNFPFPGLSWDGLGILMGGVPAEERAGLARWRFGLNGEKKTRMYLYIHFEVLLRRIFPLHSAGVIGTLSDLTVDF